MRRQFAGLIDCAQGLQQPDRLVHRRLGWMVEQRQAIGRFRPPKPQAQRQLRQVGFKNFRPGERDQRPVLLLVPQTIGVASLRPPCPAATLVGRGARHAFGDKPRHATRRVEAAEP